MAGVVTGVDSRPCQPPCTLVREAMGSVEFSARHRHSRLTNQVVTFRVVAGTHCLSPGNRCSYTQRHSTPDRNPTDSVVTDCHYWTTVALTRVTSRPASIAGQSHQ